jgi:hypothetical protein
MTTIAYRDGIMAADSRAFPGHWEFAVGSKDKLFKTSTRTHHRFTGALVGISSNFVGAAELLRPWLEAGADPFDMPPFKPETFTILVVVSQGIFLADNQCAFTGPLGAPYAAIGGGAALAMGAMAMGASAHRAVEIACDLHPGSALPVTTLTADP